MHVKVNDGNDDDEEEGAGGVGVRGEGFIKRPKIFVKKVELYAVKLTTLHRTTPTKLNDLFCGEGLNIKHS